MKHYSVIEIYVIIPITIIAVHDVETKATRVVIEQGKQFFKRQALSVSNPWHLSCHLYPFGVTYIVAMGRIKEQEIAPE